MGFGAVSTAVVRTDVTWKLYSSKDTLLGTLTIPPNLDAHLRNGVDRSVKFHLHDTDKAALYDPAKSGLAPVMRTARLLRHRYDREGVLLQGASLVEIERQPGFMFAPSAAYLRSITE